LRHDLRLPFGNSSFSYVFNFFPAFDILKILGNTNWLLDMSRALKPGGKLVLDDLNAPYVESHLSPGETTEVDEIYIHKKIAIDDIVYRHTFNLWKKWRNFSCIIFRKCLPRNFC
jgi:hypothetical protein